MPNHFNWNDQDQNQMRQKKDDQLSGKSNGQQAKSKNTSSAQNCNKKSDNK